MPKAKDKSKEQTEQKPAQKFGAEPFEIPVLPLRNTTLFPETMVPLSAGRPASVAAVEAALAGEEKLLACVSVRPEKTDDEDTKRADLFEVGTLVMIKRMERVEDTLHLIVQGTDRIRVLDWVQEGPFLKARVQILPDLETKNKEEVEAAKRNVQGLIQQALAYLPQVPPEVRLVVLGADDPVRLAYFLGSILSLGVEREQQMLEANTVDELIHRAHDFLAREVEIIRLRSKIASEAQTEMDKAQRDYVLRQQIKAINKELGEDHFGLEDVKERILEFLAVRKLRPDSKSPILCFVGAPGVGKTSLGRSISRAMSRQFERISLGGIRDEAELRGHRRTYVGAMPGRIIQSIRRAGVNNPVMMLDEIDKLGADYRGDPAAALLEILDPEQNNSFTDHYLDLPFDLSKVLFISTANQLGPIPPPLRDRMDIIGLAGYSDREKLEIAKRYLVPRQVRENGLTPEHLEITDAAIGLITARYTREAGVRQLERTIGRMARKVALKIAQGQTEKVVIEADVVNDYLGGPKFYPEEARKELPAGVATGMAVTDMGGEILFIEANLLPGGQGVSITGQLGEGMQEAARAAQSYPWSHAQDFGIDPSMFRNYGVHLHVPAGAIPKDGPSAGVTITAALASLYTGRRVRPDTSMTGEITLSGLVFPVGGIKEKVLAAHRAGIHRIILPARNEADLKDIPEDVRNELNLKTVNRINEVVEAALEETVVNPPPPVPPELLHRRPSEPDIDSQPLIAKSK